jgi:hypothetical protein
MIKLFLNLDILYERNIHCHVTFKDPTFIGIFISNLLTHVGMSECKG